MFVMEKRFFITVLLVFITGGKVSASQDGSDVFFNNFDLEAPINEAQCDQMQMRAIVLDSATFVNKVPILAGQWVSSECEIRPGPEFLLRSYSFLEGEFKLLQHFYEDESCVLPSHTVVARGGLTLNGPSRTTPSGTESDYTLTKVTIIPHTHEASLRLTNETQGKCVDRRKKTYSWKPHREYTVYHTKNSRVRETHKTRKKLRRGKMHKNNECLLAAGVEFNELKLIRTQWRPVEWKKGNKELLLGDIHSKKDARFSYTPTGFQVPLLKRDETYNCDNCRTVADAVEFEPPHLLSNEQLPPLPNGQWVSQRCEVRPLGMFLTRRFSFDSGNGIWIGNYKFHADPFCTEPVFSLSFSGKYLKERVQDKEKRKTGTGFDFLAEEASLTLYNSTLKDSFNAESNCGIGQWEVGIPKELSPTSGCSLLGIVLPSTEYGLMKLEMDYNGNPLLLMGLPDTENWKRLPKERPTSYEAPLIQCSIFPQQNYLIHHAEFYSHAGLISCTKNHTVNPKNYVIIRKIVRKFVRNSSGKKLNN